MKQIDRKNEMRLMRALDGLDDDFLLEAADAAGMGLLPDQAPASHHTQREWSPAAIAACICAVALGVYLTLLMTANGTFKKIAAFFEKTGETESESTKSDTDLPDVPKMPANPYEGMSEDDLIAVYPYKERGYCASELLLTIETPLYFIFGDFDMNGDTLAFDKQSGEFLPVDSLSDAAESIFTGVIPGMAVDAEAGEIYIVAFHGINYVLWKTDLRFTYAERVREWDSLAGNVRGLMLYDGSLYYVWQSYLDDSPTGCVMRYDLSTGEESVFLKKDGQPIGMMESSCGSCLYYAGEDGSVMRYDLSDDTDECVVPASLTDKHSDNLPFYVYRVEANGEVLQLAVAGEGSRRYLWYNTLTGKSGEMKGGLPAGGSEWMLNDDGTRLVGHPLEGGGSTSYTFTLDGLPCTLTDPVGSLQLLCYDGTCLYLRLTCPAQPDGSERSALVLFDPASGEVYCSSGYVQVKSVIE